MWWFLQPCDIRQHTGWVPGCNGRHTKGRQQQWKRWTARDVGANVPVEDHISTTLGRSLANVCCALRMRCIELVVSAGRVRSLSELEAVLRFWLAGFNLF